MPSSPRVFVSYSHDSKDHCDRVLALTQDLRADGIDAQIDRFAEGSQDDWPAWMQRQIEEADFVLTVCTANYRKRFEGRETRRGVGRGVTWEGLVARLLLYDEHGAGKRFVPIIFSAADVEHVPRLLRGMSHHLWPGDRESLLRRLTDQPEVVPRELGPLPVLPPRPLAEPIRVPEAERSPSELETMIQELERTRLEGGDITDVAERVRAKKVALRQYPTLQEGDVLGDRERFALDEKVGAGGFAEVWKGWDRQRQAYVALKILHGQHASGSERHRRFLSGARKQAGLRHPNIVRVLEIEDSDESGWVFFAMEFVEGSNLRSAVLEQSIDCERALAALVDVAAALEHAWAKSHIVHRDVKPANILLDRDGHAYLTDFDLVHAPESTMGTVVGQGMGTYDFAAPEVLRGERATHASDVYSLAMTALWTLSGGCAQGRTEAELEPAWSRAALSPAAQRVLRKGLSPRPERRPASAVDLVDRLRASLGQRQGHDSGLRGWFRAALASELGLLFFGALALLVWIVDTIATGRPADPQTERAHQRAVSESTELPGDGDSARRTSSEDFAPRITAYGGYELLYVPGGRFTMGSPAREEGRSFREGPQHEVVLDGFYLGRAPVTNREYAVFLEKNPDQERPRDWGEAGYNAPDQPVVGVSWLDAKAYCDWAGLIVPTEAQWEYACRAGTRTRYWSGDAEEDLARVGWYAGNSGNELHAVGEKPANLFGLVDMHGNVWEWCQDEFGPYDLPARTGDGLRAAVGAVRRVVRGGAFDHAAGTARSASRISARPSTRSHGLGFRPARASRPGDFTTSPPADADGSDSTGE